MGYKQERTYRTQYAKYVELYEKAKSEGILLKDADGDEFPLMNYGEGFKKWIDKTVDKIETTGQKSGNIYKAAELMFEESYLPFKKSSLQHIRKEIEKGLKENLFGDEIALAELKAKIKWTTKGTINQEWFRLNALEALSLFRAAGGTIADS